MEEIEDTTLQLVSSDSLEKMERAQTDIQISTAKAYPRVMSKVKQDMVGLATLDQETAASCFYTLKRKGEGGEKIIQGPSARLAEIAVNSFGNIKAGARIIGNDGKMITAQGVCHDLEKNVCVAVEVRRRITNKYGKTYSEDMQVVTGNAACSIALRNAIFKVIPMALVKPVYEHAKKAAVGDSKTLATRRESALKAFGELGVEKAMVFSALNVKGVEDIGLTQLEILIGMHTAIKDGDSTVEEMFAQPQPAATTIPPPRFSPVEADEKAEADAGLAPANPPVGKPKSLEDLYHDNDTPQGQLEKFMTDAKVSFENFRKWAGQTERLENADSYATWSELPADFCDALKRDTKSIARCVTLYGAKG